MENIINSLNLNSSEIEVLNEYCTIVLSSKPYSNVTAKEIGLDEKDWQKKSMLIRRAHECTHFFTKQTYGIAYKNLHDELMADFMGHRLKSARHSPILKL